MRHLRGRLVRAGLWRRRLIGLFTLAIALAIGAVVYLGHPDRIGRLAAGLLTDISGADVRIGSARFGIDGTIELTQVELRVPNLPGDAGRFFESEQVRIRHNIWSLLRGRFDARSLTFVRPQLYLTEDLDSGKFNYEFLRQAQQEGDRRQIPSELPEVFIRSGSANFGQIEGDTYTLLGTLSLSGNLMQVTNEPGLYSFRLRQDKPGQSATELSGKLDLKKQAIATRLDGFTIEAPQRAVLPRKLREWWDQLDPAGSMPAVSFAYDPDAGGIQAALAVENVALTIPKLGWRMTGGTGKFTINDDGVTIKRLRGQVEGIGYEVNGVIHGYTADAAFSFEVKLADFTIPEDPQKLPVMPPEVVKQFQRFAPSGSFSALAIIKRDETGDKPKYQGILSLIDAKLTYAKFPYPLRNVEGQIKFDESLIEIVHMEGVGESGARVSIRGKIAPPGDGAAVDMTIDVFNLPVDQVLDQALRPKEKMVVDLFRDQEGYGRLVERGLVQPRALREQREAELFQRRLELDRLRNADEVDPDQIAEVEARIAELTPLAAIPAFDLGGTIERLAVKVRRDYGPTAKYLNEVEFSVAGMGVLFKHWPYPFRVRKGTIKVDPSHVIVQGIIAESVHSQAASHASVSGTVQLPHGEDRRVVPDLKVAAVGVPVDELLIASIPDQQAQALRDLHIDGRFEAVGKVFHDDKKIDFGVTATLADAKARPFGGNYAISDLAGQVKIGRGYVQVEQLAGKHDQGTIEVSGSTRWLDDRQVLELAVHGRGLRLEDPVADLVPPNQPQAAALRQAFDLYKPAGAFDADLDLYLDGGSSPKFSLALRPESLSLLLRGKRIELSKITGDLICTPEGMTLTDWQAALGSGWLSATGTVGFGQPRQVNLTVDAQGERIDQPLKDVLPPSVVRVIDGLALTGSYRMDDARFVQTLDETGKSVLTFEGKAQLVDGAATAGVPITGMAGELAMRMTRTNGETWPSIELNFEAKELRAAGRRVATLSIRMDNRELASRLDIHEIRGDVYGGSLLGHGAVDLAQRGRFRSRLTLQDVPVGPFIKPDEPDPHAKGVLAANLSVEGTPGERDGWQGRGALEIRDASMYELPVGLAVLQVINFTLPTSKSFDRAAASFLLDGNLIRFDSVRFEAPSVEVVGDGTMVYDTRELDLRMFSRNPAAANLGPLSDMINVFKDELVMVHVGGTLEKPVTSVQSFAGMKQTWEQIFGSSGRDRRQPVPLRSPESPAIGDASGARQ